jgi:transposase
MNKPSPGARRQFDDIFKKEAINHWQASGKSAEVIADELGIHPSQLFAWKRRWAPAHRTEAAATRPATLAEAQALLDMAQREIRHLREQRDILKKTLGILSEPPANVTNGSTR